ncbi:hypothetical protein D3C85_897680 [compost metagenome]
MGDAGFSAGVTQVLGMFDPSQLFGLGDDHADTHEHLDGIRISASRHGTGAHLVDLGTGRNLALAADEDALGMLPREHQPALGTAGLEQHRRALRRRLAQVIAFDLIELTVVPDFMHLVRSGVDPLPWVVDHRVVFPTAFPEFVEHLQVFIGLVVAAVVLGLLRKAHGLGSAVQVAGDDVPAHPATAQVVEGRHASGEQVGRLVGQVGGEAEAQMPGYGGHGRNQQQGVVDRQLDRLLERYLH